MFVSLLSNVCFITKNMIGQCLSPLSVFSQWTHFLGWSFVVSLVSTGGTNHYGDVVMSMMASQITSLTIVYSTIYSGADQIKHQSSASLAFVRGIHRSPVNSPHKWPVTQKMFPFDDVIMHWKQNWYFDYLNHVLIFNSLRLSDTYMHW